MRGRTRQIIGGIVLTVGVVVFFNSFDVYSSGPYWLAGAVMIIGALLFAAGWKLVQRGRSDSALELSRGHDQPARRQREVSKENPPET